MNRKRISQSLFDPGRLVYVVVIATLVIVLDVTVLDLVGVQSTGDAVAQFVTVTVSAYVGVTLVDLVFGDTGDE